MTELHLPWLELSVILLLTGAIAVRWVTSAERARVYTLAVLGASLICNLSAWVDFARMHIFEAHDRWDLLHALFGVDLLIVDEFSAPLLMLTTLLSFLTVLSTLRTKVQRVPFSGILISQVIVQGIFSTKEPWLLIGLMGLSILPPLKDLINRQKSTRVFTIHMGVHFVLLVLGWLLIATQEPESSIYLLGGGLLVVSILIRSGVAPLHCWMTDLFEHAAFGTSILFVAPMVGAYAAVRLVMPVAPEWGLKLMALASLFTTVYASGMAMVQCESRRFYCYIFLSHASLVLVGLETVTPEALTGGLCVWFSVSLSLTGFGLTLRSVESRLGRLSLSDFHGLYDHMPNLAVLFLITGLASVGFPGTIGFVSTELLVDGVIHVYPYFGLAVVAAAAINGISILGVYFRLFTGTKHTSTISLQSRWPERLAVMTLVALMIGGGLYPQSFIASRNHAAEHLIQERQAKLSEHGKPEQALKLLEVDSEVEVESEADEQTENADRNSPIRAPSIKAKAGTQEIAAGSARIHRKGPYRNRDAISDH